MRERMPFFLDSKSRPYFVKGAEWNQFCVKYEIPGTSVLIAVHQLQCDN